MLAFIRSRQAFRYATPMRTTTKKAPKPVLLLQRWKQTNNGPDPNRVPVPAIPRDKLQFSFTASSGPGGQNVNHVNTKVELRFKPADANWIPEEMRQRFIDMNKSRINKEGQMIITSQRERKQEQNLEDCVAKLKQYLNEASWIPKERIATEVPEYENTKRIEVRFRSFWSFLSL